MFVELIDRLRCANHHDETWLVAAATHTVNRRLSEATLACPVCDAEFEVRSGEVFFGASVESEPMPVDDAEAMRAAALLSLEERALYLLEGGWGSLAPALPTIVDIDLLLVDPPMGEAHESAGQGVLRGVGDRWPLAPHSLRGLALDHATPARLSDAVRVLSPGGRLVAPSAALVPAGVMELARDDRHWVAERLPDVIALGRARR
jgi:hypothetical protein